MVKRAALLLDKEKKLLRGYHKIFQLSLWLQGDSLYVSGFSDSCLILDAESYRGFFDDCLFQKDFKKPVWLWPIRQNALISACSRDFYKTSPILFLSLAEEPGMETIAEKMLFFATPLLYQEDRNSFLRIFETELKERAIGANNNLLSFYGSTHEELNQYMFDVVESKAYGQLSGRFNTSEDIRFLRLHVLEGDKWKVKLITKIKPLQE